MGVVGGLANGRVFDSAVLASYIGRLIFKSLNIQQTSK